MNIERYYLLILYYKARLIDPEFLRLMPEKSGEAPHELPSWSFSTVSGMIR
jgi:hypothetical protein